MDPVLTIAVPTYNRADFLDRCLGALWAQISADSLLKEKVELVVSNNCSPDHTEAVIRKYSESTDIRSFTQQENVGPDRNIANCFEKARGKFVWIFGDDDILLPGALKHLVAILEREQPGVLLLKALPYDKQEELQSVQVAKEPDYVPYTNNDAFYDDYHFQATFITGNIVNKSLICHLPDLYQFKDTFLIQLGWTLPAMFSASRNCRITDAVIASKTDNTGGYNLVRIFCSNYNAILRKLVSQYSWNPKIIGMTNKKMIVDFFPMYLYGMLYRPTGFKKSGAFGIFLKNYSGYPEFWSVIFPIYLKYYLKLPFKALNRALSG